jgi:type IV pilus assembly protein PilN
MTANQQTLINLSSDPFRRERATNALYALACAVLFCLLIVMTTLFFRSRAKASRIHDDIAREEQVLQQLQAQQRAYSAVLSRPRNADIFSRSVFLNELIARRAVSWSVVFRDLQTVMPANMRLETIRLPQTPAQQAGGVDRVQLDMTVGTDNPETVILFLKNLIGSDLFGAASVVSQTPPTQNDPLFKYRVSVSYAQAL